MILRNMAIADIPSIAKVHHLANADGPLLANKKDSLILDCINRGSSFSFVFINYHNELFGYIGAAPLVYQDLKNLKSDRFQPSHDPNVLHIYDLAVNPLYNGSNVGLALLSHTILAAAQQRMSKVSVFSNPKSLSYFTKNGFYPTNMNFNNQNNQSNNIFLEKDISFFL